MNDSQIILVRKFCHLILIFSVQSPPLNKPHDASKAEVVSSTDSKKSRIQDSFREHYIYKYYKYKYDGYVYILCLFVWGSTHFSHSVSIPIFIF